VIYMKSPARRGFFFCPKDKARFLLLRGWHPANSAHAPGRPFRRLFHQMGQKRENQPAAKQEHVFAPVRGCKRAKIRYNFLISLF
jgi:hypothetical protein